MLMWQTSEGVELRTRFGDSLTKDKQIEHKLVLMNEKYRIP